MMDKMNCLTCPVEEGLLEGVGGAAMQATFTDVRCFIVELLPRDALDLLSFMARRKTN